MTVSAVVTKWGNSQGIRLSRDVLSTANLKIGDSIEIIASENEIMIKKVIKCRPSIEELFANYDGDYRCEELTVGPTVGKEL